jgi:hypothetical protein
LAGVLVDGNLAASISLAICSPAKFRATNHENVGRPNDQIGTPGPRTEHAVTIQRIGRSSLAFRPPHGLACAASAHARLLSRLESCRAHLHQDSHDQ